MNNHFNPAAELHFSGIRHTDDKTKVIHAQQVGHVLNLNDELKKNTDEDWNNGSHMKKVAQVPQVVWLLWESMGITRDPKELHKVLERNPEYKTTTKRLI